MFWLAEGAICYMLGALTTCGILPIKLYNKLTAYEILSDLIGNLSQQFSS